MHLGGWQMLHSQIWVTIWSFRTTTKVQTDSSAESSLCCLLLTSDPIYTAEHWRSLWYGPHFAIKTKNFRLSLKNRYSYRETHGTYGISKLSQKKYNLYVDLVVDRYVVDLDFSFKFPLKTQPKSSIKGNKVKHHVLIYWSNGTLKGKGFQILLTSWQYLSFQIVISTRIKCVPF